jgi:hypothetical protein
VDGSSPRVRVLYVGGVHRSGSTLADLMIGQLPGHVGAGELFNMWSDGPVHDVRCACGAAFTTCPFTMKTWQLCRMMHERGHRVIHLGVEGSDPPCSEHVSVIPRELYEAASVDGGDGAIDRFLTVTWPMLGPVTMFVVITSTITAFKAFDTIVVLTRGGPLGTTETVLYILYLEGFTYFRMGYAAALTVALLVFLVLLSIVQAYTFDRKVHYE